MSVIVWNLKVGDRVKRFYDDGDACYFYVHDVDYADIGGWRAILYFESTGTYSRTITARNQEYYHYTQG